MKRYRYKSRRKSPAALKVRIAFGLVAVILVFATIFAAKARAAESEQAEAGAITKANLSQHMLMKTRELLDTLEANKALIDADYDAFYAIAAKQIATWVDSKRLARGVMGKHFKVATEQEVDDFITTMQSSLLETYNGVLGQLVLDSLVIEVSKGGGKKKKKKQKKPERDDRARVRLSLKLITGQVYQMQYSAAKSKEGSWRIYNIVVEGINLGLTYRHQFNSAMQDPINGGKIANVIAGWDGDVDTIDPAKDG